MHDHTLAHFVQAEAVAPLLIRKTHSLAAAGGGLLPTLPASGAEPSGGARALAPAAGSPTEAFAWARLKDEDRALEKVAQTRAGAADGHAP